MTEALNETRGADRKSLFAKATLHFADGCCSIKLRNISPTGAQVEAENLPRRGTVVEVRRGGIGIIGTVMWRQGGRAGVAFHTLVDVDNWMPRPNSQQAVDHSFQVFKQVPAAAPAAPTHNSAISADDIEVVARLLDDLGDTLGGDAGVLFQYAAKLQALDVAAQMLRKLAFQAKRDRAIAQAREQWR